jgi:hypothetical protein
MHETRRTPLVCAGGLKQGRFKGNFKVFQAVNKNPLPYAA